MRYDSPNYENDLVTINKKEQEDSFFYIWILVASGMVLAGLWFSFFPVSGHWYISFFLFGLAFSFFGGYGAIMIPKRNLHQLFPQALVFDNKKGCLRFVEKKVDGQEETFLPYEEITGFKVNQKNDLDVGQCLVCLEKKDGAIWDLFELPDKETAGVWFQNLAYSVDLNALCGTKFSSSSFKSVAHEKVDGRDFIFWSGRSTIFYPYFLLSLSFPVWSILLLMYLGFSGWGWPVFIFSLLPFVFTIVRWLKERKYRYKVMIDDTHLTYCLEGSSSQFDMEEKLLLNDIRSIFFNVKMHNNQEVIRVKGINDREKPFEILLRVKSLPITDRINLEKLLQVLVMERTGFRPA